MIRRGDNGGGLAYALLAAGLLVLSVDAARAQSTSQPLSVDQIRACMCERQTIELLRQRLADSQSAYDDRNRQIQHLSQQIDQMQATMDPADASAQDQLSELMDLRARVEQKLNEEDLPKLQRSTRAFNSEVADYNGKCVNRPMYEADQKQAMQNLVCPKP
jgi:chromosome segregation ATPase